MKILRICFAVLLASLPLLASAQLVQPARLEVELEYNEKYPTVIPAKDAGLMLVQYKPKEARISQKAYAVNMYNNVLDSIWQDMLVIDNDFEFIGYDYDGGLVYLLFRDQKAKEDTYKLYAYDAKSGTHQMHIIEKAIPLELTEFIVRQGAAYLGGYVNYRPTVLYYQTQTDNYKVLPGLYNQKSEILQLSSDEGTRTVTVLLSEEAEKRNQTIAIKTYNPQGELIFDYSLKPSEGNNLLYGRITSFSSEAVHIAGTYAPNRSKYSRGLFIATIDSKGKQHTKFYPYTDLDNFFSYLPEKRQKRVKKRINKKKQRGQALKMNYRLLVHEVMENDSSYLLLGEAFYPKYGNRNIFPSTFYGGMQNRSSLGGVEGYKYTHAILMAFSKAGKMLYDHSFAIKDVLSYAPQQYVYVLPLLNKTVLLYMYEDEIRYKVLRGGEVLEEPAVNDLATRYENDEVRYTDEDFGGMETWYGKYVMAYGVQRIHNSAAGEDKGSRRVFFINKITYQADGVPLGKQ